MRARTVLRVAVCVSLLACHATGGAPPTSQPTGKAGSAPAAALGSVSFPKDTPPSFSLEPFQAPARPGYQGRVGALWVVDHEDGTLTAIAPKTGKLLGKAETWPRPHDVLVSPDGKQVWVSSV